jgi:uncharacterized membrane protein YccC
MCRGKFGPGRARVRHWLALLLPWGARLVDELECVLSVLLAITIAHLVGAQNVSWAAFSGYMVMRGHIAESLLRGTLRMLGTVLGAGLALLIVPAVHHTWPLSSLAAAAIGGISLFGALTGRRAYAWLFAGLTFQMVLLDKLEHPSLAITAFAATRVLEVGSGTAACLIVSTLSTLTARRRWSGIRVSSPQRIGWQPQALRHAAQGAVALAFLPPLGALVRIPELSQGAVSIMAVMIVPVSSLGISGLVPVSRKLIERIAGCLMGGALAAVILIFARGNTAGLVLGTVVGVLVGRHIENGDHPHGYVGTQFTLAILIALVPDSYADAAVSPSLDRLFGILVGMALLEPVLVAWHLIISLRPANQAERLSRGSRGQPPRG